jgi:hypothetical protein
MSRKVAPGQAFQANLSFWAPAHESSKLSRDEPEKWLRNEKSRPGTKETDRNGRSARTAVSAYDSR